MPTFELDDFSTLSPSFAPKLLVIGCGGAGGNAVKRMAAEQVPGVKFLLVNTDAQALMSAPKNENLSVLQIGKKCTKGLGAGARPEIGAKAVDEDIDEIRARVQGQDMVFVTCGEGGGTGTGAAPTIARIAKEEGALVVAIVTKPFAYEGRKRMRQAEAGIDALAPNTDTYIIVENERLLSIAGKQTKFDDALRIADGVLVQATKSIADIMTKEGIINVDFADCRSVMKDAGPALMGTGESEADDERRAAEAATAAIQSPLLAQMDITHARSVLLNITGGPDLTLGQVHAVNEIIQNAVGEDAEIISGAVRDESMTGRIRVTAVITGCTVPTSTTAARPLASTVVQAPVMAAAPVMGNPPRPASVTPGVTRPVAMPRPTSTAPLETPPWLMTETPAIAPSAAIDEIEMPAFARSPR